MNNSKILTALFSLLLIPSLLCFAQENAQQNNINQKKSWTLHIITYGGLSGYGKGNILLNSNGNITFEKAEKTFSLKASEEETSLLRKKVADLKIDSPAQAPLGWCSDCYVTIFSVSFAELDGKVTEHLFSWNQTTYEKVPSDVKLIYENIMKITNSKITKSNP